LRRAGHPRAFKIGELLVASRAAGCVCFLIGLLFCTSASADVRRLNESTLDEFVWRVAITGRITQQDVAFFSAHSKEFELKGLWVYLNSPGGDVDAAMKIGRIIRSVWGETYTTYPAHCYSSCALIFIAGVKRHNYGELGLHRPYFASAPLSIQQIEKQLPVMRSAVKDYVEEMGITASFFERMFNTDPSEIDILRGDDSEKIVPETDPTYDEIQTSLQARHFGITTSEYRKRESLTKSCYTYDSSGAMKANLAAYVCAQATRWGLSVTAYQSRSAKAEASCDYSESEKQLLEAIPRRDRISHPTVRRRDTCWVATMRALPPPPPGWVYDEIPPLK
jgi:hypothetical protein